MIKLRLSKEKVTRTFLIKNETIEIYNKYNKLSYKIENKIEIEQVLINLLNENRDCNVDEIKFYIEN